MISLRPNSRTRTRTRTRRLLSTGMLILVTVVAAAALWPARLGGSSSLIVVRGTSMEPTYHAGDLVYLRTPARYEPGDIAVYETPEGEPGAGILVIHRITARTDDGRYELQGDNRSAPDDVRPELDDLQGSALLNLGPLPTRTLFVLPLLFALAIGAAVTRMVWPTAAARDPEPHDEPQVEPQVGPPAAADATQTDPVASEEEMPAGPTRWQPIIPPVELDPGLAQWWASLPEVSADEQLALPQRRPVTRFSHRPLVWADDDEYDERDAIDLR